MTDNMALVDAETLAALKVLRGDNKKDPNAVDKEFSSGLASQIVDALNAQKETSSAQTDELIAAVQEQTAVLQKLTDLLSAKQKTTAVVVNKDHPSSVASTAGETEVVTVAEAGDIDVKEIAAAVGEKDVVEPEKETPPATESGIIRGPWGFAESADGTNRRDRVNKTKGGFRLLEKGEAIPENAFLPVTPSQKRDKGDALFGTVSDGEQLIGDSFGVYWERMRSRVDQYGKLQPPLWALKAKKSIRSFLPSLTIDGKKTIPLNSGVYYLTVKYEQATAAAVEAAIVIGEIAFENTGTVIAPGAKWTKILKGEKQKGKKNKWYAAKISEPWKNGDILRFKIDTNTLTVVYTVTAAGGKEEAKAGWRFENILAFTNVPTYPKDLRAFAYCGGRGKISDSAVKLTIVDELMKDMTSTITEDKAEEAAPVETESEQEPEAVVEPNEEVPVEPESEAVVEKDEPEIETPETILADTDAEVTKGE